MWCTATRHMRSRPTSSEVAPDPVGVGARARGSANGRAWRPGRPAGRESPPPTVRRAMTIDIRDSARRPSCQQPCHASSSTTARRSTGPLPDGLPQSPCRPPLPAPRSPWLAKHGPPGASGPDAASSWQARWQLARPNPGWASPVRKGRALMHEPTAAPLPTGAPAERLWTVHDVAAYPVDGEPSVRFQLDSFALRSYEAASWAGKNRCFDAGGCAGRGGASGRTPGPSPVCHFRLTSVDGVAPRVTQKGAFGACRPVETAQRLISRVVAVTIPPRARLHARQPPHPDSACAYPRGRGHPARCARVATRILQRCMAC